MMQTWPSQEAYMAYLKECHEETVRKERERRDPARRCGHGVSTMRICKACGVPEYLEDLYHRLWAAQDGPGLAEACACGAVTRSDQEWDDHVGALAGEDGKVSGRHTLRR
jgi:hypothetical protein